MTSIRRRITAARRHGLRPAVDIVLGRARARGRRRLVLEEEHVWYELRLPSATAAPFSDDDALRMLSPSSPAELAPFDALPTLGAAAARRRVARGGEPWLVLDGATALFACWIFTRRTPMLAARGGWLDLPDGVICLEDSVAAPAARGRGIAPRTWRALAERYAGLGAAAIVTKVQTDNAPSRHAVTKAGFREIAMQRHQRRGPWDRVSLEVLKSGTADALRDRLVR